MFTVRWVGYGRSAAQALREEISHAKREDPLAPVTVIVPSNHVGVFARRKLATGSLGPVCERGSGLAATSFVTVYRLGELLGASLLAERGRRPVSTAVIAAAARKALSDDPGVLAQVADHPATEEALVRSYQELRDLSDDALDRLAGVSRRASDIVRLYRVVRATLAGAWYDEEDLLDAAVETVCHGDMPLAYAKQHEGFCCASGLGNVILYLPQSISNHAGKLLRTLREAVEMVVIAGTTGNDSADAEVMRSVALVVGGEFARERTIAAMKASVDSGDKKREAFTQVVTTSDPDEEVRLALRAVVDATRRGIALDRIAIFYPSAVPYARLVHEHMQAAGIPLHGASVVALAQRAAGRCLLGLLNLPTREYARDEVFAWLGGAPVFHNSRLAPVARWERISRLAGVVGGRKEWDRRLIRYADNRKSRTKSAYDVSFDPRRAEQASAQPGGGDPAPAEGPGDPEAAYDEVDPPICAWLSDAESALELRDFMLGLIDELEKARSGLAPWDRWAQWAKSLFARLVGDQAGLSRWPDAERKAADRVQHSLDRLACLGTVEEEVSLEVFSRTLALELEGDLGRTGRIGEGVLVGTLAMGVGIDLDFVIVLGLAEGILPSLASDDPLIPEIERMSTRLPVHASGGAGAVLRSETSAAADQGAQLVDADMSHARNGLHLRSDGVEEQHRALLASLQGATNRLITVPRGDLRRAIEYYPSRWVEEVAKVPEDLRSGLEPGATAAGVSSVDPQAAITSLVPHLLEAGPGANSSVEMPHHAVFVVGPHSRETRALRHVASFEAGLRNVAFPASEQEYRLASLVDHGLTPVAPAPSDFADDAVLMRGIEMTKARLSSQFTRFDGNLNGMDVPSPVSRGTSATTIEQWSSCPFSYFLRFVLKVEELDDPEERLEMDPRDLGTLVHEVLERFMDQAIRRSPDGRISPDKVWTQEDRKCLLAIAEKLFSRCEADGLVGRDLFWRNKKRQVRRDLERFLDEDSKWRFDNRASPIKVELAFGYPGSRLPPVDFELPDGRHVQFSGKADRVDWEEPADSEGGGTLHVTDYKTGSTLSFKELRGSNFLERGTKLQLPIYGLAALAAIRSGYDWARGRGIEGIRASYWFISSKGNFERIGYEITDEVLDAFGSTLENIVKGIEAGVFPNHPTATSATSWVECRACDPDGLGVGDLKRSLERKREDPLLSLFLKLVNASEEPSDAN